MSVPDPKFSDIVDPTIEKIVVLSDIHGDHDNFIVNLRDNAKVIRKRSGHDFDATRERDPELDPFFHADLNIKDQADRYVEDLNYEWCGGNTHVVIVGDIVDPFRDMSRRSPNFYWPQMELKLVLFINAINKQAARSRGRVLKVLGNHDVGNLLCTYNPKKERFIAPRVFVAKYIHPEDDPNELQHYLQLKDLEFKQQAHHPNGQYKIPFKDNYHNGISRLDYFAIDQPGGRLLLEDNAYVLLKINNYVFVHGNLPTAFTASPGFVPGQTPVTYDEFNALNWRLNRDRDPSVLAILDSDGEGSPVWNRDNYANKIDDRFDDNTAFCEGLSTKKDAFCRQYSVDTPTCRPETMQIFVGHCIQYAVYCKSRNRTYGLVNDIDNQSERLTTRDRADIYAGPMDPSRRHVFGITVECPLGDERDQYRIYRVDVGGGRGQQWLGMANLIARNQIKDGVCPTATTPQMAEVSFLSSIAPQLIEINRHGQISIVRSKIRNTRIHVPRVDYEQVVRGVPGLEHP
jgi:hypothetical protein